MNTQLTATDGSLIAAHADRERQRLAHRVRDATGHAVPFIRTYADTIALVDPTTGSDTARFKAIKEGKFWKLYRALSEAASYLKLRDPAQWRPIDSDFKTRRDAWDAARPWLVAIWNEQRGQRLARLRAQLHAEIDARQRALSTLAPIFDEQRAADVAAFEQSVRDDPPQKVTEF